MRVWIIILPSWDYREVDSVWSTEGAAKARAFECGAEVEEYAVDVGPKEDA